MKNYMVSMFVVLILSLAFSLPASAQNDQNLITHATTTTTPNYNYLGLLGLLGLYGLHRRTVVNRSINVEDRKM